MLLYEEATMRSMCPVTHFMALALADGVFEECTSQSCHQSIRSGFWSKSRLIDPWRPSGRGLIDLVMIWEENWLID
jgi:hypothetical protein